MSERARKQAARTRRPARRAWFWCAPCGQRWQLALIPQLQTEGCPLCGSGVVPILPPRAPRAAEP